MMRNHARLWKPVLKHESAVCDGVSRILLTLMMIYPASPPQSLAVMTDVMIFSSYVDLY